MAVTYTNRKGKTYTLCQGETKTGKPRYFFAREPKGKVLEAIPDGYEISESVNGIVSLVKARPKLITDEEVAVIQAALDAHPEGTNYRVNRKHNRLEIYEGTGPGVDDILDIFGGELGFVLPGAREKLQAFDQSRRQYTAVMRFTLQDKEKRLFTSERMCYLGSIDDWILIGAGQTLPQIVRVYIPVLGAEGFYELY